MLAGLLSPDRYSPERRPPEQCWTISGGQPPRLRLSHRVHADPRRHPRLAPRRRGQRIGAARLEPRPRAGLPGSPHPASPPLDVVATPSGLADRLTPRRRRGRSTPCTTTAASKPDPGRPGRSDPAAPATPFDARAGVSGWRCAQVARTNRTTPRSGWQPSSTTHPESSLLRHCTCAPSASLPHQARRLFALGGSAAPRISSMLACVSVQARPRRLARKSPRGS